MTSVSDIYHFSSLSFSVYYVFKSRMCNLTFEFILHLYSLFFFLSSVEGLCCRPKYWANVIHRFDDQNSLTSKCIENWERLTHSQRSAKPSIKASSFFAQFKDAYISTFQRPDLHQRKYQFLEEKHSLLGSLSQLSARRTLYDSTVYGNWLRPKAIAKVSGILEGSGF